MGLVLTNYGYSNDNEGRDSENVNFMKSVAGVLVLGCGYISHIVKMHCFFKNIFLYTQA